MRLLIWTQVGRSLLQATTRPRWDRGCSGDTGPRASPGAVGDALQQQQPLVPLVDLEGPFHMRDGVTLAFTLVCPRTANTGDIAGLR